VDALDGRPGVFSARYGGARVSGDGGRCEWLLRQLAGVAPGRRGARFRALVVLALPDGRTFAREGVVEGRIAQAPRGESGFGYDPVFELPDGRTMAEAGDDKQHLSHRSIAIRAMIELLKDLQ
jgi:XTP/dITP diphosphohydrolase